MMTFVRHYKLIGIIVAVAAVAGLAFFVGRWTTPAVDSLADASADVADDAPEREQLYTCPMHPQVRTRDPNERCQYCGMELVRLEDDDDDDDADLPRLRVSERAAALMNIQTVPARRAVAEREVRLYGRVDYDERLRKTITAWTRGRLDELYIDFTGQHVIRDQHMVKLYSPTLIAAQEELLQAIEMQRKLGDADGFAARSARDGVSAARDRLRLLGVSASFIDELETTGTVRDHVTIDSPLSGVVTQRFVSTGDYVNLGDPLFSVTDLSHVWVELSVFESDLPWLYVGQSVEFEAQSIPGRTFEGTVAFIDPVLDDRTRSVRVRIDVPNEDGRLKPGMFVRGTVRSAMDADGSPASDPEQIHHQPLVVPASAPLITGRRAVVYVQLRDTDRPTFEARDVRLGLRAGDKYIVLEGLDEGELVVVNGQFRIDSELQIRGRPSMMQPAAEEEPPAPIVPHDHAARNIMPDDVPDVFAEQLSSVLDDYLAIVEAMSQDHYEGSARRTHTMHERMYEIDPEALDEHVRDAWDQLDRDLHEHLHAMLEAQDLDAIRPPLEPLTEFVAMMVAHFIGDRAGTVYRAHCPMVDDFRGADWLQRGRDITNPYFGSMMFRCGEIVGDVQAETDQGIEESRDQVDFEPVDAATGDVEFPVAFRDAALAALDHFDEVAGAIEQEHEDHARHAIRRMQDALFALAFDALDDATMQAWLRADVEIMDAARAILEADSLDVMREHLPHLRDTVERARQLVASNDEGGRS